MEDTSEFLGFKIGDSVRIKKGLTKYNYTIPGTEGVIVDFLRADNEVVFRVTKHPTTNVHNNNEYEIHITHIEHLKKDFKFIKQLVEKTEGKI